MPRRALPSVRVVSNLAEMQLENRMLLRVLGYNLKYLGELDAAEIVFRKVLELAPEEPQSYRDLALVLAAAKQWQAAADMMLNAIVKKPDGRFRDVELIAITELNDIIVKAKRESIEVKDVDSRLVHPLEMDLRVVIGWDTAVSPFRAEQGTSLETPSRAPATPPSPSSSTSGPPAPPT